MASPRAKRKSNTSSSNFLNALMFVSAVQDKKGEHFQTHCRIENGLIVATNGILSAGHKIEEDLSAQPHTLKLIDALSKCGDNLNLTQIDETKLSIKCEKFQAFIPCTPETIPDIFPDAPCAIIDDTLRTAFNVVAPLVKEKDKDEHVSKISVFLRKGSVVSTDHCLMIEYWHGFDLPSTFLLPKSFVTAILKNSKKLAKFGCSMNSVTFYFDDESWIKTQQFDGEWPDVDKILNMKSNPWPFPLEFYKALDNVASFSENKFVYFRKGLMCSHKDVSEGASFEVEALPEDMGFNIEYLKFVQGKATSIDFTTHGNLALFFGDKLRGAISKIRW